MHKLIELTDIQRNALIGSLLGDGHLCKQKINVYLTIARAIKDKDYLLYEKSIFDNYLSNRFKNDLYYNKDNTCNFMTMSNPIFSIYHDSWYKNKKKIIPANLNLNNQIVAHWFADDGYFTYNKLPYRFKFELSTHSFSKVEVEFLANLLCTYYKEDFLVKKSKSKYFIIKGYDNACRSLFQGISPFFKMTRKRIWDKPESRFWNDVPPRQKSILASFAARKEIVKSFIKMKEFNIIELAKELKYIYNNQISYNLVNKLLKPYFDSGIIYRENGVIRRINEF